MMNWIISRGITVLSTPLRCEAFRNCVLYHNFRPLLYPATISCNKVCCYSSDLSQDPVFEPVQLDELKKKYQKPVDWLPFAWHRRKKRDMFVDSGDLVQELEYDPSWPKPNFELSDELKTANDGIKRIFSLTTGSKAEIKEVIKRNILKKIQRHPNDLDSIEVRIALETLKIRALFEHKRDTRKEMLGRAVLESTIYRRNNLLKELYRTDRDRFNWLVQELKLEYKPYPLGVIEERYCKKLHLRQLTKAYCKKMVKEKKAAYHEELKRQQADFLKEKEELLAWIEKEEKELANLTI